jgi:hypothetical protein
MIHAKVRSVCPHRFLMVTGIDHTRSFEMSRCYKCGTLLIRPLRMPLPAWFPFLPTKLHLIPRAAQALRRKPATVPPAPRAGDGIPL